MYERQFRIHLLELDVLRLECLQLPQLGCFHTAICGFPFVINCVADAVLATCFVDFGAKFNFPQQDDDLLLTVFRFLHYRAPFVLENSTLKWIKFPR